MSYDLYKQEMDQKLVALSVGTVPDLNNETMIVSFAQRLSKLEKEIKSLKSTILSKNNEIEILNTYNTDLESVLYQHHDENDIAALSDLEGLRNENQSCKRQIVEMELFLADYGMEWVGFKHDELPQGSTTSQSTGASTHKSNESGAASKSNGSNARYFNIDVVLQKIQEINSLVSYGHIAKDQHSNVHHFTSPPRASVVFYSNGIFLKNGPLRVYELKETKQFIRDILDGFFPSELRSEFPNGVIFDVMNCIEEQCAPNKVSPDSSLISKLPQKVVRNGKIIEFKSKFPAKADVICIDTPIAKLLQSEGVLLTQNNSKLQGMDIVTLRVKSSNHNITLILKMSATNKMAAVYELVDQYLQKLKGHHMAQSAMATVPEHSAYEFELFTPIPQTIHDDLGQTLEDAGLVPNATLFLRYRR